MQKNPAVFFGARGIGGYAALAFGRAAQNIVAARPIKSIADLDAVAYVGGTALKKLKAYLPTWTPPPPPPPTGGTYDGVTFTAQEEKVALEIANTAHATQLAAGGIGSTQRKVILDNRPWASLADLAAFSGVGTSTMQALRQMVPGWAGPEAPPPEVSVADLEQEAGTKGVSSQYFDKLVVVSRAIVTSEPNQTSAGSLIFWVADPAEGDQQQMKVYVTSAADQSTSWVSIFDDVRLEARFTKYGSTFQLKLSDPDQHTIALYKSGLAFEDYLTVQAAWKSTAANPEGVARVSSTFGYIFMVPMPLFLNHPMWGGNPPAKPNDSGNEQDLAWNAAAQQQLNAWHAANP